VIVTATGVEVGMLGNIRFPIDGGRSSSPSPGAA